MKTHTKEDGVYKTSKRYAGFTIVELTVVVTIIAILGTIGFITMTSYLTGSRDTTRLADMNNIYTELGMAYGINGMYPMPENPRAIALSGTIMSYQGYAGKSVLSAIKFEKGGKDPKDNTYYTYTTNKKQSQAQLMGYFEDYDTSKLSNSTGSPATLLYSATAGAYTNRRIGVIGKSICMLVETGSLAPVQTTSTGTIDIGSTPNSYTLYCDSTTTVKGTGAVLSPAFVANSVAYRDVGNLVNIPTGPVLYTNNDGSTTPYIPDNAHGSTRFIHVAGTNSGIVKDNLTGLEWESQYPTPSASVFTWTGAKARCAGLTITGQTAGTWRLPDVTELQSIVDYSKATTPSIDTMYFGVQAGYWSSTTYAPDALDARTVEFQYGSAWTVSAKTFSYYVRCVRGTKSTKLPWQGTSSGYYDPIHNVGTTYAAETRFTLSGGSVGGINTVVKDSVTGLMWQSAMGSTMTWTSALSYCTGQTTLGYSGWRLPSITELQSIVDYSKATTPSIDTTYFGSDDGYWSSTVYATDDIDAWFVSFLWGGGTNNSKDLDLSVRCVR